MRDLDVTGAVVARKDISKKLRFEVFKRDKFTCQYCGRSAPEVILHADHIQPVSKDGETDITNLITSCQDCNLGKGDRELSDDAVIQKRKKQLDDLQERREQLEMMVEWQRSLIDLGEQETDAAVEIINSLMSGHSVNEHGRTVVKKLVTKYGLSEVIESAKISASQYIEYDSTGKPIPQTISKYFEYIEKIARSRKRLEDKPYLRELYYIRGIIRHRFSYCVDYEALALLERAYLLGHDTDELKAIALEYHNWSSWRDFMEGLSDGE